MYAQPDGITDELLETMASLPNVVRYLDLPLQHAARPVLRRMRRRGSAAEHLALLERIRSRHARRRAAHDDDPRLSRARHAPT